MFKEKRIRSIVKTLSWRIIATTAITLIVFIFSKESKLALAVGGTEALAKTLLYFFHERLWDKIHFGKKQVEPFVLWFTGLSGSGKSTLADKTYKYLKKRNYIVECIDGDVVRSIFPQTGFSKEERDKHIKRIGFLASMLEKNGIIVISSFISPYTETRNYVRGLCNNFIEIHVDASLEECERRDTKGLYKKARAGEIKNFTGINDPYEKPQNAQLVIDTNSQTVEKSFQIIKSYLEKYI